MLTTFAKFVAHVQAKLSRISKLISKIGSTQSLENFVQTPKVYRFRGVQELVIEIGRRRHADLPNFQLTLYT